MEKNIEYTINRGLIDSIDSNSLGILEKARDELQNANSKKVDSAIDEFLRVNGLSRNDILKDGEYILNIKKIDDENKMQEGDIHKISFSQKYELELLKKINFQKFNIISLIEIKK